MSELISDSYGQAQKRNESEDVFADDLQILAQNIIAQKPEFWGDANNQLKYQYPKQLWDPYYAQCPTNIRKYEEFHTISGPSGNDFGGRSKLG